MNMNMLLFFHSLWVMFLKCVFTPLF